MPIVTFKFDLPEEEFEFKAAVKGKDFAHAMERISNEIFRPARKHGYQNQKLQDLMDKTDGSYEIVGILEDMFFEILREENLNFD